jgi:hypothetical protein
LTFSKTEGQKLREELIAKGIIIPVREPSKILSRKAFITRSYPSGADFSEHYRESIADEDVREAHRNMGFPARETGRYGSHALHDQYDDEAMP